MAFDDLAGRLPNRPRHGADLVGNGRVARDEALKEKADALLDRGMAKAKEAAAEVYETARGEADRQGLVPSDTPVADKIGAVARAVGETAGEIVERHAPEPSSSEETADGTFGTGERTDRL